MKHLSLFGAVISGGLFGAHVVSGHYGFTIMSLALVALNIFFYALNDN